MGSAYHFCNQTSPLPDDYVSFLKLSGKVKDAFNLDLGTKPAQELKTLIAKSDLTQIPFSVIPVSTYRQRLKIIAQRAKDTIAKEKLLIVEYHDMRKELRHVMNLFQIAAVADPNNQAILQTFHYLCVLNSELDDVHDIYVELALKGEIDYPNELMEIPHDLRLKVEKFLKFLDEKQSASYRLAQQKNQHQSWATSPQ